MSLPIPLPDGDGSLAWWAELVDQVRSLDDEIDEWSARQLDLERKRDELAARLATLQAAFPGGDLAARRHRLEGLQIEVTRLGGEEQLDKSLISFENKLAELLQQIVGRWGVAGRRQYLDEADFVPIDPRRDQMWAIAHAPGPPVPLPRLPEL